MKLLLVDLKEMVLVRMRLGVFRISEEQLIGSFVPSK
jgi:hypothetical protein